MKGSTEEVRKINILKRWFDSIPFIFFHVSHLKEEIMDKIKDVIKKNKFTILAAVMFGSGLAIGLHITSKEVDDAKTN